ncbi:hypothetical protein D1223_07185 [Henriciella mobilis]|uniref:Uncharacterized protein n=1 Tax=Henriciella mobilis TaxID=2305467 RepID=A0A399RFP3_9PROT|nr:hypothetical protein D1223_07185 [Henriciella mobilis]
MLNAEFTSAQRLQSGPQNRHYGRLFPESDRPGRFASSPATRIAFDSGHSFRIRNKELNAMAAEPALSQRGK